MRKKGTRDEYLIHFTKVRETEKERERDKREGGEEYEHASRHEGVLSYTSS